MINSAGTLYTCIYIVMIQLGTLRACLLLVDHQKSKVVQLFHEIEVLHVNKLGRILISNATPQNTYHSPTYYFMSKLDRQ